MKLQFRFPKVVSLGLIAASLMLVGSFLLPVSQSFTALAQSEQSSSLATNSASSSFSSASLGLSSSSINSSLDLNTSFGSSSSSAFSSSISSFSNFSLITASSSSSAQVLTLATQDFDGEITKIEENKLTVVNDQQTKEFTLPSNIKISRNQSNISLDQLQVGDKATITYDQNGSITQINVTGREVGDTLKWLLPVTVLLLVLAFLIWHFWNKSQKGRIKTTTDTTIGKE